MSLPLALTLLAAAGPQPEPPSRAYAVIVANNLASDPTLERLRYADDDGARYHELFSLVAARTEILSVLDADTQRVYPAVAREARAPSRRELLSTLDSVYADIARDNQAGYRTVLYFVFVGHGSVGSDGEGTVHLLDGRFSRSDLFQRVIEPSPARVNHVIIDACNAFLMVARRGADANRERAIEDAVDGFVGREGLQRHPNTGVLVSTSQAAEVHEWSRFQAGIFSHEVRSAFVGAADVDDDGVVGYDEARAFIGAANARIRDPRTRLAAYAAAPAINQAEPLFDRRAARGAPVVHVPGSVAGHRWLEDARGVRYADFNVAPDGPLSLVLVPSSNLYFLRSDVDEIKLSLAASARLDAGSLPRQRAELALRGSEALSFQKDLFAVSFGRAYFEGFRASLPIERDTRAVVETDGPGIPVRKWVAGGLGAGALGALAGGILFSLEASARATDYRTAIGSTADVEAFRTSSESAARNANILYVASGALVTSALVLWLLPASD